MKHTETRTIRLAGAGLVAALLLLVAPAEAAQGGTLAVERATLTNASAQGPASAIAMSGDEAQAPQLRFQAGMLQVTQYDDTYVRAADGASERLGTGGYAALVDSQRDEQEHPQATVTITAFDPTYRVHIYNEEEPFQVHTTGLTLDAWSLPALFMHEDGSMEETGDQQSDAHMDRHGFRYLWFDEGHIVADARDGKASMRAQGDFIVELAGVEMQIESEAGRQTIYSGAEQESVHEGSEPADPVVQRETRTFVRLAVNEGDLQLQQPSGAALLAAAFQELQAEATHIALTGAEGQLLLDGETLVAAGGTVELDQTHQILLQPGGQTLAAGVAADPASSSLVAVPSTWGRILLVGAIGGGISTAGLAAGASAIRRARNPSIDDIEFAIETERYSRAARMSARVLRRDPSHEDAAISRAIALTKAGNASQVVREVPDRLDKYDASDGVLHYILGLAHMELGHDESAKNAFHEAVRRTPGLAPQVQEHAPGMLHSARPQQTEWRGMEYA